MQAKSKEIFIKTIYKKELILLKRFLDILRWVKRFNCKKVKKSFAGRKKRRNFAIGIEGETSPRKGKAAKYPQRQKNFNNMARSINTRDTSIVTRSEMVKKLLADLHNGQHEPMTEEEEQTAFANRNTHREEIIQRNLLFVYSVAKRYARDGEQLCDYFSEGAIGLADAVDKFEPERGFKFISFAVHYIRAYMSAYAKESGLVKSSNANKIGSKVKTYEARYYAENGKMPTDEDILSYLKNEYGIEVKYTSEIHGATFTALDAKIDADSDDTASEVGEVAQRTASLNEVENTIEEDNRKQTISILLNCKAISETEREVIKLWYLEGWDKERIAKKLGLCGERIRQIQATALKKLKGYAERHRLTA